MNFKLAGADDLRLFFLWDDGKLSPGHKISHKILCGIIGGQNILAGLGALFGLAFFNIGWAFIHKAVPQGHQNKDDDRSPKSAPAPLFTFARCLRIRSEEHTSELQSRGHLVCRLLLEKKKKQDVSIYE